MCNITAKNTVISPDFLVCKFCEKAQFLCGKCSFPQNFHTRKLGETTVFFAVHVKPTKPYLWQTIAKDIFKTENAEKINESK